LETCVRRSVCASSSSPRRGCCSPHSGRRGHKSRPHRLPNPRARLGRVRPDIPAPRRRRRQAKIDPATLTANTDSAAKATKAKVDSAAAGAAVKGAARGAAGGAIIGGIAGDAGTGAAIGAATGAVAGRRAKKQATAQAEQVGAAQAEQQVAQKIATFKKAMSTCLEGKGYSVK